MAELVIKLRGDTASNWASTNPILVEREVGVETNTRKLKFGDGTTAWNGLPYAYDEISLTWADIEGEISENLVLANALDSKQNASAKNAANGYAGLNSSTQIDTAYLPGASKVGAGILRMATDAEAAAGTNTDVAVSPKQVANVIADMGAVGIIDGGFASSEFVAIIDGGGA